MSDPTRSELLDQRTVGELAASLPGATSVFEWFDLDYCCSGYRSLAQGAQHAGIPVAVLRERLERLDGDSPATTGMDSGALIEHLLAHYHERHRRDLPELIRLAGKVEAVHQFDADAPIGLAEALAEFERDLSRHMATEEQALFPAMRAGDTATATDVMAALEAGRSVYPAHIHEIEALTNHFSLPPGACRTWQALYFTAARFVDEVRHHVHLENNVLFPRFSARPMIRRRA